MNTNWRHSHEENEKDRGKTQRHHAAFDAFVWLSAKDRALSDDLIADTIGRTMAVAFVSRIPTEQKVAAVNDLLRAGKCLVVVDNFDTLDPVRDAQAIGFVLNLPEPTKVLITSRKKLDIDALSLDLRSMRVTDSQHYRHRRQSKGAGPDCHSRAKDLDEYPLCNRRIADGDQVGAWADEAERPVVGDCAGIYRCCRGATSLTKSLSIRGDCWRRRHQCLENDAACRRLGFTRVYCGDNAS